MYLTKTIFLFSLILLSKGKIHSQNIGININDPDYTLDVRSTAATNSSILNISDPLGNEYFQLKGPNSTDLNPGLIWKEEVSLNFTLYSSKDKIYKDYLKFNGRGIEVFNTGQSIFIGEGSGNVDDLISNHNVGIGNLSMNLNVSGVSNVAVGSGSLRNNLGGNDNVAIGRNAGLNNDSGNFNVAIGHSALLNNQSGARNTVIGTHAGQGSNGVSYSGNVLIGYDAGNSVSESDRLFIDNTNTSDPLIYGEFDNDFLKVNGNAEVTGNINLGKSEALPNAGDIRFNPEKKDFEGYDGEKWLSLTKGNQLEWGYATGLRVEKYSATPSDGQIDDEFGFSVAISGDYAIVGAPGAGNGKAYIFHYVEQCWIEEAILTDPNGQSGDQFGFSVAISGNYAVVGAPYADYDIQNESGRALFFERNGLTWILKSTEEPDLPRSGDNFGFSIGMDGDFCAIGVPGDDYTVTNQGSVYIMYNFNGDWSSPTKKIVVAPDPTPSGDGIISPDAFGSSVAISGDNVVVGAPGHNSVDEVTMEITEYTGAIYLFERGANWTIWNIEPNNIEQEYYWANTGSNVGISGNQLQFSYYAESNYYIKFINGDGPNGWLSSAAIRYNAENNVNISGDGDYVLKGNIVFELINDNWQINARLITNDNFGYVDEYIPQNFSVAISGEKIVLGNPDYLNGPDSGKVYFYHK